MANSPYFTPKTFAFLRDLRAHNNHAWFREHKDAYEEYVREPALRLIGDLQAPLAKVSGHMVALPKKQGGSLFRVMKDTRREHIDGPYKPWVGLRFFHAQHNDVHAPSYFVHIGVDEEASFMGGGLWRPESPTLKRLRQFIDENPTSWKAAIASKSLKTYEQDTNRLTQMPRGYPPNHALAEELKRRSFVWTRPISHNEALSAELPQVIGRTFKDVAPVVDYLCAALDLPF
jgi:uncharacterized protein (TIGR02453 family)